MSDDEVKALRAAAQAATPGPWAVDGEGRDVCDFTQRLGYDGRPPHEITGENGFERHVAADDARYIAAANPDAVLRLLTRLEAAEAVCEAVDLADPTTVVYPLVDAWRAAGGGK
jgi:hypothetical protein